MLRRGEVRGKIIDESQTIGIRSIVRLLMEHNDVSLVAPRSDTKQSYRLPFLTNIMERALKAGNEVLVDKIRPILAASSPVSEEKNAPPVPSFQRAITSVKSKTTPEFASPVDDIGKEIQEIHVLLQIEDNSWIQTLYEAGFDFT